MSHTSKPRRTLVLAGPFTEADGETMNGSLVVIEAASLQAAKEIARRRSLRQSRPVRLGRDPPLDLDPQQPQASEPSAMNYWLFKSEPDAWSWDQQKKEGAQGRRMGRRAQLPGAQRHARDEKGRSRLLLSLRRGEAHCRGGQGGRRGASRLDRRDRRLGVRRCRRSHRREEAGDACRDQGEQGAQGHGAGQQFEALGAAGFRRRMEYHQPACRA